MGCSPTPRGGPAGPRSTHRHKKGLTASPSVSVSWGYGNKEPQMSGMEKTEVHFPTGLEARSLKSRGGQGPAPPGAQGRVLPAFSSSRDALAHDSIPPTSASILRQLCLWPPLSVPPVRTVFMKSGLGWTVRGDLTPTS